MVTKDYYQKELRFQDDINATKNANHLTEKIQIEKSNEGLKVKFPLKFTVKNTKGSISLYRPSNKKLDFEIPISLTDSFVLIPKERLVGGRWNITVTWQSDGKNYLYQEEIMY